MDKYGARAREIVTDWIYEVEQGRPSHANLQNLRDAIAAELRSCATAAAQAERAALVKLDDIETEVRAELDACTGALEAYDPDSEVVARAYYVIEDTFHRWQYLKETIDAARAATPPPSPAAGHES